APLPGLADRPTDPRRAGAPLSLPLLAKAAAAGNAGDLRSHLVWPGAGRAGRGPRRKGRLAARLRRDQPVRGHAGRGRHAPGEAVPAYLAAAAARPLPRAPGG